MKKNLLLGLSLLSIVPVTAQKTIKPVTVVNGFNADVVVESLPVINHLVMGIDNDKTGFYTSTVLRPDLHLDAGIPTMPATIAGNVYDINFASQQTVRLTQANQELQVTFANEKTTDNLSLLVTSGNGTSPFSVTPVYASGAGTPQDFQAQDWWGANDTTSPLNQLQRVSTDNNTLDAKTIRFFQINVVNEKKEPIVGFIVKQKENGHVLNVIGASGGTEGLPFLGNADVIAEGYPFGEYADAPLDNNKWVVYVKGTVVPAQEDLKLNGGLPNDGIVNTKSGATYFIPYDKLNALRLGNETQNGELQVQGVTGAQKLYLCGTCGSGPRDMEITVHYTDETNEAAQVITFKDWFRDTPEGDEALYGLGRYYNENLDTRLKFRLYEGVVTVNPEKTVSHIAVHKTTTAGCPIIIGVAAEYALNGETLKSTTDLAVLLPSKKWSSSENWSAYKWSVNSGKNYNAAEYNKIFGVPAPDAGNHKWYEPQYSLTDNEAANWEYAAAPFTGWAANEVMGDIYVRRYFTVTGELPETLYLSTAHDDAPCEFYLNGVLIFSETDGWEEAEVCRLTPEQRALIHTDGTPNVLAFHVHQNWGGYFADAGLYSAFEGANTYNNELKPLAETIAIAETEAEGKPAYLAAIERAKTKQFNRRDIRKSLANLRKERKLAMSGTHPIPTHYSEPADKAEVYLYNVGAGLFLAGGNDWGTHTSLNYSGAKIIMHTNTSGPNRYSLQSNLPNGVRGVNDWIGHNGYVDCGKDDNIFTAVEWAWEFAPIGDGKYHIINSQNQGENIYFGMTDDERLQVDTDKSGADNPYNIWMLVSKADRDAMLATATREKPVDASYYISQSTFSRNDFVGDNRNDTNAELKGTPWERNAGNIWNYNGNSAGGDYVYEMWNTSGEPYLKQVVKGLPKGYYTLVASSYYRDGSFDAATNEGSKTVHSFIYAGNRENNIAVPSIMDASGKLPGFGRSNNGYVIPDGCYDAAKYFQYGLYKTAPITAEVGENGELEIGIFRENVDIKGGDWTVSDNFRLYYLGTLPEFADVSIGKTGYATFVAPYSISLENEKLQAFAAQKVDEYVHLEPITNTTLNVGEAIILKGEAGDYKLNVLSGEQPQLTVENQLVAAAEPVTATGVQYILADLEGVAGFAKATPGTVIPAGKGYMSITTAGAGVKAFYPFGDGNATAIDKVVENTQEGILYNLSGQRVNRTQKGIYIINGKKVLK